MSANDNRNVTLFRWKIVDLSKQRKDVNNNPNGLTSDNFSLRTRPSIQFVLFVSSASSPKLRNKNAVKVVLKKFDGKPFEASVKLWIESTKGQKFGETFVEKHVFDKIGSQLGYNGLSGKEKADFLDLYKKHETFYICCEIIYLDAFEPPVINCDQVFLQNQWDLYENETFCDAVIIVGDEKFKVSKFVFSAQSKVFKSMFESNYKIGITTSVIELKHVTEETMKHLVKWVYINKLEDDAPVEKLFAAADRYDIALLKTTCTQLMIDSLSEDNAFSRLVLASVYNNNELMLAALDFINKLSKGALIDITMSDEYYELKSKNQAVAKDVKQLMRNMLD